MNDVLLCRRCHRPANGLCDKCRDREARRFERIAIVGIALIGFALWWVSWRPWGAS